MKPINEFEIESALSGVLVNNVRQNKPITKAKVM